MGMMHVLGFSGGFFQRKNMIGKITIGMNSFWSVTHPKVIDFAKKYFGCDSVEGVPLENGGGQGSAGSHWEKTIFPQEIMNPQVASPMRISEITVIALEAL